jgi:hypothetical protein
MFHPQSASAPFNSSPDVGSSRCATSSRNRDNPRPFCDAVSSRMMAWLLAGSFVDISAICSEGVLVCSRSIERVCPRECVRPCDCVTVTRGVIRALRSANWELGIFWRFHRKASVYVSLIVRVGWSVTAQEASPASQPLALHRVKPPWTVGTNRDSKIFRACDLIGFRRFSEL